MPATVAWWETVWASPMASQFLSCDVPTLERLADLIDRTHRGESGSRLLAEIRALEDRFGLSPLARRRLQWEMPSAEAFGELTPPVDLDEERFLRALD